MPFINNSVDKSMIRAASRSGKLTPAPKNLNITMPKRAQSSLNKEPQFEDDPAERLYSSPAPRFEYQVESVQRTQSPERNFTPKNLVVPLEFSHETAFSRRMERGLPEVNKVQQIGDLGAALIEKKYQLTIDTFSIKMPEIKQSAKTQRPTTTYHDRLLLKEERPQTSKDEEPTTDKRRRLEEKTRQEIEKIKPSKSLSQYGKSLDIRAAAKPIKPPKKRVIEEITEPGPQKKQVSEWIIKQRAGQLGPIKPEKQADEVDDFDKKRQEAIRQKKFIDEIVIGVEEVLPIFKCIAQKIELQKLIKQGSKDVEIQNYITKNKINVDIAANFKPQEELEAIIAQERDILKMAPEVVSASLKEHEFIYLTYDTAEIRRMIINQYLKKEAKPCYDVIDPNWNPYELVVCTYDQIDKLSYFTMSPFGLSYVGEEPWLISLMEWEDERNKFIAVRKLKFIRQFLLRKSLKIWKDTVLLARRHRSYMVLLRISLLSNKKYVLTIKQFTEMTNIDFEIIR